jgi:hypothetical protein
MEKAVFPEWANTLVNGAIAASLLWGVATLGDMGERLAVLEKTISQSIELSVQKQVSVDLKQDQTVALLDQRVGALEKLQLSLRGSREVSGAVATVSEYILPSERLTF